MYFCREVKHISTARYEVIINIAKDSSLLGRGMDGQGLVPGILKTHGIFIVKPIIFSVAVSWNCWHQLRMVRGMHCKLTCQRIFGTVGDRKEGRDLNEKKLGADNGR